MQFDSLLGALKREKLMLLFRYDFNTERIDFSDSYTKTGNVMLIRKSDKINFIH